MNIKKKFEQIQSSAEYLESILDDVQDCLPDIKVLSAEIAEGFQANNRSVEIKNK